jgi:hypothetical protein
MRTSCSRDTCVNRAGVAVIADFFTVVRDLVFVTVRGHSTAGENPAKTARTIAADLAFIGDAILIAVAANEWCGHVDSRCAAPGFVQIYSDTKTGDTRRRGFTGTAHTGDEIGKGPACLQAEAQSDKFTLIDTIDTAGVGIGGECHSPESACLK